MSSMLGAGPPWKNLLLSSLQANSHLKHSSYFQLATVTPNGRPSNRTVVFRGFQDDTDKILINTDTRTGKIDDLKHCSFAEICWYFTESWEQFRISGQVDMIDASNSNQSKLEQREKSWFASSLKSRQQYMAPAPGIPSLNDDGEPQLPSPPLDPSVGPVSTFCLLVMDPQQVDYLNLRSNERSVFTSSVSGSHEVKLWTSLKVNP